MTSRRPQAVSSGTSVMGDTGQRTRAAIYARYSSDSQSDASIEDQLRLCKEFLAREGWDLVQVYRDAAISGSTSLRPGYQALLEGAREAAFDVVMAEALDRLSRDQEDTAALHKRLRFAGIRLVTLAEGEISELHVGLKGTMNALFLRDLAQKTHRGLRGRVEAGRSAGGNAYGYEVLRRLDEDGEPVRGGRRINEAEAEVVRRIFRDYAAGVSPKRIALQLNADKSLPPLRGGAWSPSTINGNRQRGTGILNNEMYAGKLVWNRLRYIKDPETGRRRSRPNANSALTTIDFPELRIVPDELWAAVKQRQAELDAKQVHPETAEAGFWSKQRPRYLFSGLMTCGVCGAGFSKISASHFGCSGARNKGPTVCTNRATIRRDVLEQTVLGALRERLMDPAVYKVFASEFIAEWNRQVAADTADEDAQRTELERVRRQIARVVDAIADGAPAGPLRDKLAALEARRIELEQALATPVPKAPRLHPNLAEVYRERVAELTAALEGDDAAEMRDLVRGLIEEIRLVPDDGRLRVEVRGELVAILGLAAGGTGNAHANSASGLGPASAVVLAAQIKMVAGTGNHRELTLPPVAC